MQEAITQSVKRRAGSASDIVDRQAKASQRRRHAKEEEAAPHELEPHDEQYNYLTFQRAPPTHLQSGSTVKVSALIANDLRDAVLLPPQPLTLRLAWVTLDEARGALAYYGPSKTRAKSTWNGPQDAYRSIEVLVPTCKGKVEVRLAMWIEAEGAASQAKDEQEELLRNLTVQVQATAEQRRSVQLPLPVLSAPIFISPTAAKASAKTSSITRLLRLSSERSRSSEQAALLQIHESTGHALEKHIWDAALRLIHLMPSYFLNRQLGDETTASLSSAFDPSKSTSAAGETQPLRVIELGAGTALLSIAFAALWAVRAREVDEPVRELVCWATDLEAAVSIMEENIALNANLFNLDRSHITFKAEAFDWNDSDYSATLSHRQGQALVDVILISDCTYNCDSFTALAGTIARLLVVDSSERKGEKEQEQAFCLLAKKHRHQGEQVLWRDLEQAGLKFERVAGTEPVSAAGDEACAGWGFWYITLRS